MVLTSPGPHALLLVIPLGRYTPEGQKATEKILAMFGERAREHMILLFTRKDDLDGMDFHDYLKKAPTAIQELIRKFRNRYCVFNNKATGAEQEDQREQLLALVQDVVPRSQHPAYWRWAGPCGPLLLGSGATLPGAELLLDGLC